MPKSKSRSVKKAEHEAELKRIRTEFLEKETSRIESEVRTKFEAIAEERDAARQIEEQAAAEAREAERLAREEAEAEAREAERLVREEAEAEARVAARIAEEEKAAAEREAERIEARKAARIDALYGSIDGKKKVYRAVRREPKGD